MKKASLIAARHRVIITILFLLLWGVIGYHFSGAFIVLAGFVCGNQLDRIVRFIINSYLEFYVIEAYADEQYTYMTGTYWEHGDFEVRPGSNIAVYNRHEAIDRLKELQYHHQDKFLKIRRTNIV